MKKFWKKVSNWLFGIDDAISEPCKKVVDEVKPAYTMKEKDGTVTNFYVDKQKAATSYVEKSIPVSVEPEKVKRKRGRKKKNKEIKFFKPEDNKTDVK